jgi:hypothetical protein
MDRMRVITLLSLLGLFGLPAVVHAQATSPEVKGPVADSAHGTLKSFPWYDAKTGELKRIDVKPPGDVKNRDSKWLFQKPNWSMPDWVFLLLRIAAWTVLVMLITLLAYLLAKAFMNLEGGFDGSTGAANEEISLSGDVDRVDALPFQLKRPRGDLLAEAKRLYEEGRYAEAMIYLYSYQLVQLDKNQVIRLTRGKTNRQYLREVRRGSNLFELMQLSMVTFEDVFFGDHRLDRSGFELCWTQLDEFHHQLDPQHALA